MGTDPTFQVWSGPRGEAGAVPYGAVPAATSMRVTESVVGGDEGATMVLPTEVAMARGFRRGRILRADWPLRGITEWVIVRVIAQAPGDTVSVTLGPLRQLLALRGFVRVSGAVDERLELTLEPCSIPAFLAATVLRDALDDGLGWLSVGVDEFGGTITPGTVSLKRRGEALGLVEQLSGYECVLRALPGNAGYAIDTVQRRNGAADLVLFEAPGNARSITITDDLLQCASVVQPTGDDSKSMGEVDWVGGVAIGSGPYWIPLTDPTGGPPPLREDQQCQGAFLALPNGTTLPILATRASDSAVQVASLGAYTTGMPVVFWANATGRPVSRLTSPSALTDGPVIAHAKVTGARAERTLNVNAAFESGGTGWAVGAEGAVIARQDFDVSWEFQAAGARGAATAPSTPFTVDGAPPDRGFYAGDTITHVGADLAMSAAEVPTTSGVLALAFSPGLPANFADDDPVILRRFEPATLTIPVNTPLLSGILFITTADSALMQRLARFAVIDGYGSGLTVGDLRLVGPGGEVFDGNIQTVTPHEDDPDVLVVRYGGFGGSAPSPTDTLACTNVIPVGAQRLRCFVPTTSVGGTHVILDLAGVVGGSNLPEWQYNPAGGATRRFTGLIVGTGSLPAPYLDIDVVGLPAATSLTGMSGYVPTSQIFVTNSNWSGSVAATWLREARELRFQGSHSSGATTATFKPIAVLARRNWLSTDTLYTASGHTFPLGAGATWADDGTATLTVTIGSGVTLRAGERAWCNWHGSSTVSQLIIAADVTGPAASVIVRGGDAFRYNSDAAATPAIACYQVPVGAHLEIAGNTLHVAVSSAIDGAGAASLTLVAANANAIPDNATLRLTRPAMIPAGERPDGHALRLLFAPGGNPPNPLDDAPETHAAFVAASPDTPREVTAVARVVVSPNTLHVGTAPLVAIVRASTGAIVATGTIAGSQTYAERTVLTLSCTAQVTQAGMYLLRLYGGSSSDFTQWHVCLEAHWYVGGEVLPYAPGARSRLSWHRAQAVLAQRASAARAVVSGIDQALLTGAGLPVAAGQLVRVRVPRLQHDRVMRAVRLSWGWPGPELLEVECDTAAPRFTDVAVSL